tara:strand:- start:1031 stop:2341 length:1311 start_codon:yes stop_codon:yes gene_type:complete
MCGITGIYDKCNNNNDNLSELISSLEQIQHRGKDSCGISYNSNNSEIKTIKDKGTIHNVFGNGVVRHNVKQCIGHVRYTTSTMGEDNLNEIQPISNSNLSLVHNGNIPNVEGHDTSFIFNLLESSDDIVETLIKINNNIAASYCFIILNGNDMYIMRDKYGIRPLSYGIKGSKIIISSETIGLVGCTDIEQVKSGELLKINDSGIHELYRNNDSIDGLCSFELIYFMNPLSIYNDILIKDYRRKLGEILASKNEIVIDNEYIVIGIPNSGIEAAKAYSGKLNIKYSQSINKKNLRNEGRSFILKTNEERIKACKKFTYDVNEIKNKKIIIVDDTIVRGNVMNSIISNIKSIGVKEIHVRIPAPPVVDICQLGIAINSKDELIMNNRSVSEVSEILGVDSLQYLDLKDLSFFPERSYTECFGGGIPEEITCKCIIGQ